MERKGWGEEERKEKGGWRPRYKSAGRSCKVSFQKRCPWKTELQHVISSSSIWSQPYDAVTILVCSPSLSFFLSLGSFFFRSLSPSLLALTICFWRILLSVCCPSLVSLPRTEKRALKLILCHREKVTKLKSYFRVVRSSVSPSDEEGEECFPFQASAF